MASDLPTAPDPIPELPARPPEPASSAGELPKSSATPDGKALHFSITQLGLAFAIAGISDVVGAFVNVAPPLVWVLDLATALLLFAVLGRQWLLVPGLILEAIPGLGIAPFWLLVVGAIVVFGTPRPRLKLLR